MEEFKNEVQDMVVGINEVNDNVAASEFDMPKTAYDYAMYRERNKEFYRDPTFHEATKRYERYEKPVKENIREPLHYSKSSATNEYIAHPDNTAAPVYARRKSKRYEVVGMIMRICELADFELAERVVLKDKRTGEILR